MLLVKYITCGKIAKQMEEIGMNADQVIECMKFCNHCAREGVTFKEILDWIEGKPEDKTIDKKDEILEELDKAIMSTCKDIYCDGPIRTRPNAELVKALADLIEVRTCMPDWKYRHR